MPYVTAWSAEKHRAPAVILHPSRKEIGFSGEKAPGSGRREGPNSPFDFGEVLCA